MNTIEHKLQFCINKITKVPLNNQWHFCYLVYITNYPKQQQRGYISLLRKQQRNHESSRFIYISCCSFSFILGIMHDSLLVLFHLWGHEVGNIVCQCWLFYIGLPRLQLLASGYWYWFYFGVHCTLTGTLAQRLECSPMARETWVQSQVESYQRL